MAALGRIVGPVPFKDVVQKEEDEHPPEEYADIIATLPSITTVLGRCCATRVCGYARGWSLG